MYAEDLKMLGELFYSIIMLVSLSALIISCFRMHYKVKCAKKIGQVDDNSCSKIIAVIKEFILP